MNFYASIKRKTLRFSGGLLYVIGVENMKKLLVIVLLIIPRILFAEDLPNNSHPNIYGTGWDCDRGYYKSGDKCVKVIVPENASIDIYGSGWACNKGYKKANNVCAPMTKEELQKQKEQEQALIAEIQRRKAQGISGDVCETEYKTNAEVCIRINGADLDCNESYGDNYYRDCDVTLSYEVQTDYEGGSYIDVDIECRVEIEYKGKQTYGTQSDSSNQDESHSLYAHDSETETMYFNFSFSSYKEITSVKISSAECEIDNVELE